MSEQNENNKPIKASELVKKMSSKITEIGESGATLPAGYDPSRAVWEAYLSLQDVKDKNGNPALNVAKESSIARSLTQMILKGLSPGKNHCAFVCYGDELQLLEQYEGKIARASRESNLSNVTANLVYEGDEFDYEYDTESGELIINKHKSALSNISSDNIVACYCVLEFLDKRTHRELMTFEDIRQSWKQGSGKESPAHTKFPGEMAKKTVISRALKFYIDGLSDIQVLQSEEKAETGRDEIDPPEAPPGDNIANKAPF